MTILAYIGAAAVVFVCVIVGLFATGYLSFEYEEVDKE